MRQGGCQSKGISRPRFARANAALVRVKNAYARGATPERHRLSADAVGAAGFRHVGPRKTPKPLKRRERVRPANPRPRARPLARRIRHQDPSRLRQPRRSSRGSAGCRTGPRAQELRHGDERRADPAACRATTPTSSEVRIDASKTVVHRVRNHAPHVEGRNLPDSRSAQRTASCAPRSASSGECPSFHRPS